ncbi:MAG: PAC2 family protein [Candidatus Hydrogenedentes bacterium]|nr:PAC2 family protein [Candidatus Hydrogenedentota bacterium]
MVLGFSGWMDGGDVSTGVLDFLIDTLDATRFAEIDPAPFYVYNIPGSMEVSSLFRPHVRIEDGLIEELDEPENAFFLAQDAGLVLFTGKEPNMAWESFAECIISVAEHTGVTRIYFVGSVAGLVPHTREPRFFGSVSGPELRTLLEEHGIQASDYEGPGSFVTYLTWKAREHGIGLLSLVAGIPSYVDGRNTKCIRSAVRKLMGMLGLTLDTSDLDRESARFERQLTETVQGRHELAEQIRKIEALYDETSSDTREDDLRAWFEKQGFRTDWHAPE